MYPDKKLLNLINSELGYNLKEKVRPVIEFHKLPSRAIPKFNTRGSFYELVEKYGPFYVFNIPEGTYLVQKRDEFDKWVIYELTMYGVNALTENRFLSDIKIRFLGLSLDDIVGSLNFK